MGGILILGVILALVGAVIFKGAYPWRILVKLALNMLVALIVLCLLGIMGDALGFHLPINWPTVLLLAVLGLPGLGLLMVLNFLLV